MSVTTHYASRGARGVFHEGFLTLHTGHPKSLIKQHGVDCALRAGQKHMHDGADFEVVVCLHDDARLGIVVHALFGASFLTRLVFSGSLIYAVRALCSGFCHRRDFRHAPGTSSPGANCENCQDCPTPNLLSEFWSRSCGCLSLSLRHCSAKGRLDFAVSYDLFSFSPPGGQGAAVSGSGATFRNVCDGQ